VLQDGIADCHDTYSTERCANPPHIYNPIADLIEYAFTHDEDAKYVYAYMKGVGDISKTANLAKDGKAGRAYIQVMLDVDNNVTTGICSNLGGYYPFTCGVDINFEIEMYNGSFNSAYYILHSMQADNTTEYNEARQDQMKGIVSLGPKTGEAGYRPYTEWAYWYPKDPVPKDEQSRCPDGPYKLPDGAHICFVEDKVNGPFLGSMKYAFSKDNTSVEIAAPTAGFLKFSDGTPVVKIGTVMSITFALETSGEFSIPSEWISDSSWTIRGYAVEPEEEEGEEGVGAGGVVAAVFICLFGGIAIGIAGTIGVKWYLNRRANYQHM